MILLQDIHLLEAGLKSQPQRIGARGYVILREGLYKYNILHFWDFAVLCILTSDYLGNASESHKFQECLRNPRPNPQPPV